MDCKYAKVCTVYDNCISEQNRCHIALNFMVLADKEKKQKMKELLKELIVKIQDDARTSADYFAKVEIYIGEFLEIVNYE